MSAYATAATSGSRAMSFSAPSPGRSITTTPASPMPTAAHRRGPTVSCSMRAESAVITSGATKKMEVASAIVIAARARKKVELAMISIAARAR